MAGWNISIFNRNTSSTSRGPFSLWYIGVYWGSNPLTNLFLPSCDIQVLLMVQKSGDHQLRLVVYPIICKVVLDLRLPDANGKKLPKIFSQMVVAMMVLNSSHGISIRKNHLWNFERSQVCGFQHENLHALRIRFPLQKWQFLGPTYTPLLCMQVPTLPLEDPWGFFRWQGFLPLPGPHQNEAPTLETKKTWHDIPTRWAPQLVVSRVK